MARINDLEDFLDDVSSAIKQKLGDNSPIPASEFDTKILSITTPGLYQNKELSITQNGNYVLNPDQGFDALSNVRIGVDVEVSGNYVEANPPITPGTKTKITYDEKGLVTGGTDLIASDIPDLSSTYIATSTKGQANGVATLDANSKVSTSQIPDLSSTYLLATLKGANNGVAELGNDGKVPNSQLPSYVDDVIEGYYYNSAFYEDSAHTTLITGETGKIYVDLATENSYRYSGSAYIKISNPIDIATQSEAETGSDNTKMMTPLRTKQAIETHIFYIPISSLDTTTTTWDDLYDAYSRNAIIIAKIDYLSGGSTVPIVVPLYSIIAAQNGGTLIFTFIMGTSAITYMVTGTTGNTCTITKQENSLEVKANKVQSITSNSTSQDKYPSTKAVFDEFQRKPVVVWESNDPSTYLLAIQADLSASPAWQLTNLDLTPFKRIKIYSCAGRKSSGVGVDASTTPAIVLEMSLDSRAAISAYGGNYVASAIVQKPNDANRFASLTCAVSADKTSFVVLRQTSLYGTAATSNNDANANVFMIEGYYD